MIVGISGIAGSGKTTFASMVEKHVKDLTSGSINVHTYNFAEPLKNVVSYLFNTKIDDLMSQEGKKKVNQNGYGLTNREVLQKFGTESMRDVFDDKIWIDIAERSTSIYGVKSIILIPDTRFDNEAIWIKQRGILIDVLRPEQEIITPQTAGEAPHRSEQGHTQEPHFKILNDGSFEDLDRKARIIAISIVNATESAYQAYIESSKAAVMSHFAHGTKTI